MNPYAAIVQTTVVSCKLKNRSSGEPGMNPPRNVAPSVSTAPMRDASTTCPGRILYMYRPTNSAIGIVSAMVNVPHELPGTTRTASGGKMYRAGGADWKIRTWALGLCGTFSRGCFDRTENDSLNF